MAHVVCDGCVNCKHTDCVDVCPVDAFREGPNFLVIDPDECIDCAVCIPECPEAAIFAEEDVPSSGLPSPARSPLLMTGRNGLACRISFST